MPKPLDAILTVRSLSLLATDNGWKVFEWTATREFHFWIPMSRVSCERSLEDSIGLKTGVNVSDAIFGTPRKQRSEKLIGLLRGIDSQTFLGTSFGSVARW